MDGEVGPGSDSREGLIHNHQLAILMVLWKMKQRPVSALTTGRKRTKLMTSPTLSRFRSD